LQIGEQLGVSCDPAHCPQKLTASAEQRNGGATQLQRHTGLDYLNLRQAGLDQLQLLALLLYWQLMTLLQHSQLRNLQLVLLLLKSC
jgi:hypothetical protein